MTSLIVLALARLPEWATLPFLADTPAAPPPADAPPTPGPWGFLMPLLLVAAFYFLFIAPQTKRQKEQQKLLTELKPGDEVVTASGIFGTITQVKADRFIVEIAKGVRVEIRRAQIEARVDAPAAETPKS